MLLILHTNNASKGIISPCLGCSIGEGLTLLARGLFALQGVESLTDYARKKARSLLDGRIYETFFEALLSYSLLVFSSFSN